MIPVKKGSENQMCNELLTMINYNDTYAMKYYGCSFINEILYIFCEYIPGIDLYTYLTNPQNNNIQEKDEITKQLLIGLYNMHRYGIYHRDIKPENIMIIRNVGNIAVKYIDFGFSCQIDNTCKYANFDQGTLSFISPEFAKHIRDKQKLKDSFVQPNSREYILYDLWALGITLYMLYALKTFDSMLSLCIDPRQLYVYITRDINGIPNKIKIINLKVIAVINDDCVDKIITGFNASTFMSTIRGLLYVDTNKRQFAMEQTIRALIPPTQPYVPIPYVPVPEPHVPQLSVPQIVTTQSAVPQIVTTQSSLVP
jgi:serine/threonine protein kinase